MKKELTKMGRGLRIGQPQLGTHLASLNLFHEADGSVRITVAGASADLLREFDKHEDLHNLRPIDYVNRLVVEATRHLGGDPRQRIVDNISKFVERIEADRKNSRRKLNQPDIEAIRMVGRAIALEEL